MGMKDWLNNVKKKAEDYLKEETDPAKIRAEKKAANERKMKRTAAAIKLAQKGNQIYNDVSDKVEKVTDAAATKTVELVEKAKPLVEKVDQVAGVVGDTATGAFNVAKEKVVDGVIAAGGKIGEIREDNAKKPSTGSGLLDLLAPAVPSTDATKPKTEAPEAPKAAKPPAPPKAA